MEEGTDNEKTNINSFYDIILLFKRVQGGRAQIFFNLMPTYYVKGRLMMLRPEDKIVLRKMYFHF